MAKSIMIQGTASGAGKSLLTAGLCRLLARKGLRVAPFKSQNMALNSYLTPGGLELGRAQAMQAEAAGVEASADMNPILLKPHSDVGSQVILNGEVLGVMSARDYFAYKPKLIPHVLAAYNRLAGEYDVMVIEGAGSPAEINLRDHDIVNMGLARLVGAPVLLAGDIDRGGVFASLYGTLALLEERERPYVKGLVINKFRGDLELLRPGLAALEELTGLPVAGVVPFLSVDLEDEDSLAPRLARRPEKALLDVAVVRLPHLSNFTDFHPLEVAGAGVRYVARPQELGRPDLLILPGTKNTMGDLRWLRRTGLEAGVLALAAGGTPVMGICGGYQMLGRSLRDDEGVEEGGCLEGLGLLPLETTFLPEKSRGRAAGRTAGLTGCFAPLSGAALEGYEIHMGRTRVIEGEGCPPFALLEDGRPDGAVRGSVLGSYLHGLFDSPAFTGALLELLLARRGLPPGSLEAADYRGYKERQYNLLADALEASLDMERVCRVIEEGITP